MGNLSRFAGGGLVYTPSFMLFDGATGFYSKTGITVAGNKVEAFIRFSIAPFTGDVQMYQWRTDGPTRIRAGLLAWSDDYTGLPNRQSRLQLFVADDTGAVLALLLSPVGYLNSGRHIAYVNFDGDAGTAQFIINGVDVDDLSNLDRVAPSVGNLETGLGSIHVGSNSTSAYINGQLSFFGFREAASAEWSDYMTPQGFPKDVDWSAWQYANPACDMENNLGSDGNMIKNGLIVVGDAGNTGNPILGLPTIGDVVAAEVDIGKICWVDGQQIVGTREPLKLAQAGGIEGQYLSYNGPEGSSGAFVFGIGDALLRDTNIAANSPTMTIATDGFMSLTGAFAWFVLTGAPAKAGVTRYHQVTIRTPASPAAEGAIAFSINRTDSDNYWMVLLSWTGSAWKFDLYNYEANVISAIHTTYTMPGAVDGPALINLTIADHGDAVSFTANGVETDDLPSSGGGGSQYYESSRPDESSTGFGIRNWSSSNYEFNNLKVWDVG